MAIIATAEVRVVADTSRFVSNLRKQLRGAFSGIGVNLGRDLGRDIGNAASRSVQDSLNTGLSRIRMTVPPGLERRIANIFRGPAIQAGLSAASNLVDGFEKEIRNRASRIGDAFASARAFDNLFDRSLVRTSLNGLIVDFGNAGFTAADTFNQRFNRRLSQRLARVGRTIRTSFRSSLTGIGDFSADVITGEMENRMRQRAGRIAAGLGLGMRRSMGNAATAAGNIFSERLGQALASQSRSIGNRLILGVLRSIRGGSRDIENEGRRTGRSFGNALSRGAVVGIRALGQALSSISIRPLTSLAGAVRNMSSEMVDQIGIMIAVIGLVESLSGLLFALPAALSVAGLGIATAVVAFQGFGTALSAAFDDLSAFEDAIEDLAPAAQTVAREFRVIAPALTGLRIDVQEALFRQLEGTLADVAANLMGPVREGMTAAGAALGTLVAEIGEFFAATATADTTTAVFETIALLFDAMAASAQPFLEGMRNLTDEFLPRLTGLAEPLSQIGAQFRDWTEAMIDSGQAAAMFDHAVQTFQNLLGVISALGSIFRAIFDAAATAGVDALGSLVDGLEHIAETFNSFAGQNALVDVFESLSTIIPIVAEFMGALLVEFGALTPIFAQIAEAIGPALITVVQALGDALQAMGPGVVAVFDGIAVAAEAIAPSLEPLGEAIGTLLTAIAPILPVIGELVGIVIELGAEIIGVLASAIMPIAEAIASALLPILPQLSETFSSLIEAVAPLIQVLGEGLAGVIETLLPPVLELALALADALLPIIEALVPVIAPLLEIAFQLAEVIGALLVPVFALLLPIIEAISPLFELLGVVLAPLLELFVAILEPITTLITMIADLLTPVIEFLAEIIGTIISVALVPLTAAFEWLGDMIAEYVIPYFEASLVVLQQFWENAIEPLIDWVRDLSSTVSDKFGTIRDAVGTLSDAWQSSVGTMIDWLQGLWDNVVETFSGVQGSIDIFKQGWESFWGSVESIASSAWDFIQGIVDSIGSAISSVTDAISNFDLGSLNPFADGGIVTYPTAALIGEAGTEVVIPMTRPQRAVELAQQSGLIDLLAARGALPASTGPSGPPIEMHVHSGVADAEQVARRAARILQRQTGPRGLERVP